MNENGPELDLDAGRACIVDLLEMLIGRGGFRLRYAVVTAAAIPAFRVQFSGPDTALLLLRHAELLHSFEHLAAKALRLEPEQHELIRFDAEGYKEARDEGLYLAAAEAVKRVQSTGRAHSFPPMTSRERRMLHLALAESGLFAASEGEGPQRHLVLHPRDV